MAPGGGRSRRRGAPDLPLASLLGPAFVASVAYVDPGNVAANLTAGAQYGYVLVWVLVLSSAMAVLVQYLSAKLGIVTGRTLSQLVEASLASRRRGAIWRDLYAVQALVVAMATDVAEVIGGALGLNLLFGTPMWLGALLVGVTALVLLRVFRDRGEGAFEVAVTAVLLVIAAGFLSGLVWAHPDAGRAAAGLVPQLPDRHAMVLAGAMLGATVMPHAIYLHSNLAIDRYYRGGRPIRPFPVLLRAQRVDVVSSLVLAGSVNIAMLLTGAAILDPSATDPVVSAHVAMGRDLGRAAAAVFGVGLVASGVGSAVVGTHAGTGVWRDLVPWRLDDGVRRVLTIVPAVIIPLLGIDPTRALVISQLVLSFGIAFALVPLAVFTSRRSTMGEFANTGTMSGLAWLAVGATVALNVWLLFG